MRAHTPQGHGQGNAPGSGGDSRRNSVNNRFRTSSSGGLARPSTSLRESRIGSFRATTTQPSYNLITGADNPSQARPTSRQSLYGAHGIPDVQLQRAASHESSKENVAPPDAEEYETQRRRIEELKAEVGTLRYTVSNHEQEKELAKLEFEKELRDARRRAEEDFKAKQAAEGERAALQRQHDALQSELNEARDGQSGEKREWEKKTRDAQEEARLLQEQLEDLSTAKDEAARLAERKNADLESQVATAQRTLQELEQESQARESVLQQTQQQLAERDSTVGDLEAEVLRLKAQTGDAETVAIIRRELTAQVEHIRNLEAKNREQLTELKHLRQIHRAVEVVEEEKRSLQRKLAAAELLETRLEEAQIQRQRLEDERLAWTAYLQRETGEGEDGQLEFDTPEAVARALVQERFNTASLTLKLGNVQTEIAEREGNINALSREIDSLKEQLEKAKTTTTSSAPSNNKAYVRLQRQKALSDKEVQYLRAQLKAYDDEDMTFEPDNFDQNKVDRVKELEDLVDKYREELESVQKEISAAEGTAPPVAAPAGQKRSRDSDPEQSEHVGQLLRKNRKLQDELSALRSEHQLAEKELSVTREQLAASREHSKVRVLSLRSNPTSDFEAVKTATLAALRQENAELGAHVRRDPAAYPTVPASMLAAARREVAEARAETASAQKSARRLREVWTAKSAEFKEAIFSTLGWTVTFLPGGKMRVESVYHPSRTDEHEASIVFDGEKGTMKVGGGPRSPFAQRIGDQIKFWVREKGCIPGFLAALTLEFHDEHSKTMQVDV